MNGNNPESVLFESFYAYSVETDALAANAQVSKQVQIQADSDFQVNHMTASLYIDTSGALQNAGDMPANQRIKVQLTDTGSGANLFDRAQPLVNLFGSGVRPYILPKPKIFAANSQLSVTITNESTTGDLVVFLSFIGKKLYRSGRG